MEGGNRPRWLKAAGRELSGAPGVKDAVRELFMDLALAEIVRCCAGFGGVLLRRGAGDGQGGREPCSSHSSSCRDFVQEQLCKGSREKG